MSGFRPRFFIDDEALASQPDGVPGEGSEVGLDPSDSHHALRVLRVKAGDPCEVVLGASVYAASVSRATEPVKVRLEKRLEGRQAGSAYRARVGLVQALTRPALLDHVLEKGTEVGASFFILVPASRSPRVADLYKQSRVERWQRIVVESAKQSKQSRVPTLETVGSCEAVRSILADRGIVSLALEPSAGLPLVEALGEADSLSPGGIGSAAGLDLADSTCTAPCGIALWVGPESGWSDDELEGFSVAGISSARMGQSVLRAETAGPVAVAVTRFAIGDW